MKVNLKGVKRNAWDSCMEFLIINNRLVCDCELRTLVNYGIEHGCECADDIPESVVNAILDCNDSTYDEYEDKCTRLVSTRRVEEVLISFTDLSDEQIDEVIDRL